jgi:hypothetical protein
LTNPFATILSAIFFDRIGTQVFGILIYFSAKASRAILLACSMASESSL